MTIFKKTDESQITRAIADRFFDEFKEYISCDTVVVGGGPSGLMAARELAKKNAKVLVIEANNYLGGGFWIGGYLMNKLTIRKPAQEFLDELQIPYEEYEEGLYVADGPHACSRLIAAACDAGVKILNMTKVDDVVLRNNRVSGVVINWTPVSMLPKSITCVDPVALEAKVVIDATGHDACVAHSLEKRGIIKLKGCGPMDVTSSEDGVVLRTGEVYPGLIVAGMAVSTVYGIPRMGPTFGAMLLSGQKAAQVTLNTLVSDVIKV